MTDSPYLRLIQKTGSTRHPGGLNYSDILLKRCGLGSNSLVLDVGCGAGHTAAHIAKNYGCRVMGLDCSNEALARAKEFYFLEPYFELMSFVHGDVLNLAMNDNSFDVVLCESVLLFVEDKARALRELARVVKPGGFLIVNELCLEQAGGEDLQAFFARPEIGGFLVHPEVIIDCVSHDFQLVVLDEKPFDIKEQLMADWQQWGNFRGLTMLLEAGYKVALQPELTRDFFSLLSLLKNMPKNALSQLKHLTVVAKKTGE